jgi:hypothetical protein
LDAFRRKKHVMMHHRKWKLQHVDALPVTELRRVVMNESSISIIKGQELEVGGSYCQ